MQAVIGKKWLVPLECAQALHKLHPRHIAVEGGVSHGCWQFVAVILDSQIGLFGNRPICRYHWWYARCYALLFVVAL
jgi:hypothetical protein